MALEKDESELKKSIPGITNEEREASKAKHEHGISTTTTISRHALYILTLCCMLSVYKFVHASQKAIIISPKSKLKDTSFPRVPVKAILYISLHDLHHVKVSFEPATQSTQSKTHVR
jgi:hypothetical protein